jgi:hypothetical protein
MTTSSSASFSPLKSFRKNDPSGEKEAIQTPHREMLRPAPGASFFNLMSTYPRSKVKEAAFSPGADISSKRLPSQTKDRKEFKGVYRCWREFKRKTCSGPHREQKLKTIERERKNAKERVNRPNGNTPPSSYQLL